MGNPLNKNKLQEIKQMRANRTAGQKLDDLLEQNAAPFAGVKASAATLPTLRPYSTGDPIRDLSGINRQLIQLPEMLESKNREELGRLWDQLDKVDRQTIWIRGHIAKTMSKKYGESSIEEFAEERGLSAKTIYDCVRVAEIFENPTADLSPTFYIKAVTIAHGDKDEAIKLIKMAEEKKEENNKYSVRDFIEDATRKTKKVTSGKTVDQTKIANQVYSLLLTLKKIHNLESTAIDQLANAKKIIDIILK